MSRIFGIDLGTTKTAISYVKDGEPVVIEDKSGNSVIPSMVTILENDEILVGEKSKNISIHKPTRTISGIKRHMGEDYDVEINEQKFSPPEISSYILKEICKRAEKRLDEDVSDVVITVPAYFNDRQRRATKDAAEIAGLNVKRIINEPTAVALAYGISKDGKSSNIMVYDLGGGTFDVSILEYSSDVYEVQAVDGINSVGGNDWTERIIEDINREFKRTNGYNPNDATSKRIIAEKAERVKKELSDKKETEVYIPFSSDENAELIEYRITRQEFQDMTDDLIDRTKETMIKVLGEWSKGWTDIDEILLSGSATRMNQVKEAVSSVSGINPTDELNLQEVVAKGASVQAGLLDDTVGDEKLDDAILFDVTSQALGVKIKGGLFEPIIEKNTVVPEYSSKEFTTYKNNQTAVNIEIYQGENEMAEDNVFLGEFRLTNIKEMKAGEPQVIVDFSVDSNGILTVSAEEVSSGTSKTLTVERDIGMSDKEIGDAKQLLENREHTTEKDSKTELRRRGRLLLNESKMVLEKSDIKHSKYSSLESKVNETENLLDQEDVKTEKLERNINSLEMILLDLPHYNNY